MKYKEVFYNCLLVDVNNHYYTKPYLINIKQLNNSPFQQVEFLYIILIITGRHQRPQSEGKSNHFPQKEEFAVLRHLRKIQLQFRKTFPLPRQEIDRLVLLS